MQSEFRRARTANSRRENGRTSGFQLVALGLAVALAVTIVGVKTAPAKASNLTGLKTGTNYIVTFGQAYLTSQCHSAFHHTDANDIEPTGVRTWLYGHSGGTLREVNVYDYVTGGTEYGYAQCLALSETTCTRWSVVMNLAYGYTDPQAESLMCEEIGHSVGLDHRSGSGSCMDYGLGGTHIDQHDHDHLDDLY